MYGVMELNNRKLLSRHRLFEKAVNRAQELNEGLSVPRCKVVSLRPITGYRGMIGHSWPVVGRVLKIQDTRE